LAGKSLCKNARGRGRGKCQSLVNKQGNRRNEFVKQKKKKRKKEKNKAIDQVLKNFGGRDLI
jgi:hypothetical protein